MLRFLGGVTLALGFGAPALAEPCRLLGVSAPGLSARYDPFDPAPAIAPVPIAVRTSGDCAGARVQFALTASPTSPETGADVRLVEGVTAVLGRVAIAGRAAAVSDPATAFATAPIALPVSAGGTVEGNATVALSLGAGQVASPAVYAATLTLLARLTDRDGAQSDAAAPLLLALDVAPSVRLVPGTGAGSIELGELHDGMVGGDVSFAAYANLGYDLVVTSQNGFRLRASGDPVRPGIVYEPRLLDGTPLPLVSGGQGVATRIARYRVPPGGLRRHGLGVRVGQVGNVPAGTYADVMTLEIQARL